MSSADSLLDLAPPTTPVRVKYKSMVEGVLTPLSIPSINKSSDSRDSISPADRVILSGKRSVENSPLNIMNGKVTNLKKIKSLYLQQELSMKERKSFDANNYPVTLEHSDKHDLTSFKNAFMPNFARFLCPDFLCQSWKALYPYKNETDHNLRDILYEFNVLTWNFQEGKNQEVGIKHAYHLVFLIIGKSKDYSLLFSKEMIYLLAEVLVLTLDEDVHEIELMLALQCCLFFLTAKNAQIQMPSQTCVATVKEEFKAEHSFIELHLYLREMLLNIFKSSNDDAILFSLYCIYYLLISSDQTSVDEFIIRSIFYLLRSTDKNAFIQGFAVRLLWLSISRCRWMKEARDFQAFITREESMMVLSNFRDLLEQMPQFEVFFLFFYRMIDHQTFLISGLEEEKKDFSVLSKIIELKIPQIVSHHVEEYNKKLATDTNSEAVVLHCLHFLVSFSSLLVGAKHLQSLFQSEKEVITSLFELLSSEQTIA